MDNNLLQQAFCLGSLIIILKDVLVLCSICCLLGRHAFAPRPCHLANSEDHTAYPAAKDSGLGAPRVRFKVRKVRY